MWNSRKKAEHDQHGYCPPGTYCILGKKDRQIVRNYDVDECHNTEGKECCGDWIWGVSVISLGVYVGLPGGSDGKGSACSAGDLGSISGLKRSPPEKGMAAHSSILAWRIPGTEEPGGLQSTGLQKSRTKLSD